MILSAPYRDHNPRLTVLAGAIAVGLAVLLLALFRVQVLHSERYGDREQLQSLRRIRLPAARGEIVDRGGLVLANNRPSYDIAIYLDQLGRVSKKQDITRLAESNLVALSAAMELPVNVTERDIRRHYEARRPLPLPLWRGVNPTQLATFEERASHLPGADLVVTPVRQYPQGQLAAHVLGFCGKAEETADEEVENFYYYQPDTIGKQGIERAFDDDLRGAPGGHTIRVNPSGVKVGDVGEREAERGNRVVLTLDANIQRVVERALENTVLPAGKELRATAVVLDPRNGEILALASYPTFDPNVSVAPHLHSPGSPLLNRVVGAWYAPGSTFKPITFLAGLEAGTIAVTDTADCHGSLLIGNRSFGCWSKLGHGRVDAFSAMTGSCDVWFYKAGMRTGIDAITRVARELGLGQPVGVDFGKDLAGLVPTPAWKRDRFHERWWDGDTAQLAIGQSFLLATPLQMANVAATLGNRGTRWRPFLAKRIESPEGQVLQMTPPTVLSHLSAKPQNVELVRQSMLSAIRSPQGTGHHASIRGVSVAGKTGTAEFDTRQGRIKRAWFIGFAPYEQPTVAMAVLIEDGVSGGHTAAPVAGEILAALFRTSTETTGGGPGNAD